ncbi:crotonase/enoyl-CoA hydratase family protein [Methylophaga lonarensis]|uniref:crotonase/enoyl-CoA hydratase family protein n=1 Tax=Methylophaga lonarensis TaxID=999151 RepID=UPI003D27D20E
MNAVAQLKHQDTRKEHSASAYSQLDVSYDAQHRIGWFYMNANPRPCFTPTLLNELSHYLASVKQEMRETNQQKYDFLVVGSSVESVFNLGGDLDLFTRLIDERDREGLLAYAIHCIDILYDNMHHFGSDLTTVSLIQGDALGGGFEAALSSNLIIAERGVKMGLPEVLFNLFPGMGAFSLLSRKVGAARAQQMILSGELYSAETLYEWGAVDILAEPGQGEMALYSYIKSANRSPNSYKAMQKIRDLCNPVDYQELVAIAEIWADAALKLTAKDLRMMQRLVRRQTAKADR